MKEAGQPFDREDLSAYLDGELDRESAAGLEKWISTNADAADELRRLRRAQAAAASLPVVKAPADFWDNLEGVMKALPQAATTKRHPVSSGTTGTNEVSGPFRFGRRWRGLSAAAALLLAVGAGYWAFQTGQPNASSERSASTGDDAAAEVVLSPREEARLRSMGYLGGREADEAPDAQALADARFDHDKLSFIDKQREARAMTHAKETLSEEQRRYDHGAGAADETCAIAPGTSAARLQLELQPGVSVDRALAETALALRQVAVQDVTTASVAAPGSWPAKDFYYVVQDQKDRSEGVNIVASISPQALTELYVRLDNEAELFRNVNLAVSTQPVDGADRFMPAIMSKLEAAQGLDAASRGARERKRLPAPAPTQPPSTAPSRHPLRDKSNGQAPPGKQEPDDAVAGGGNVSAAAPEEAKKSETGLADRVVTILLHIRESAAGQSSAQTQPAKTEPSNRKPPVAPAATTQPSSRPAATGPSD